MNIERYKVCGRREDNGKLVEGLLATDSRHVWICGYDDFFEEHYSSMDELRTRHYHEVEPKTVEPVPMKINYSRTVSCPVCGYMITWWNKYCPGCGYQLDWEGTT